MRPLLAVLLACFTAVPAVPQDSRFGESIEVSLVNVDVIVTDRDGRHVRGLTADDFEIQENGKLQPITNFAEYRGSGAMRTVVASAPSAPAKEEEVAPPQKRNILVFVDKLQVHGRERRQLFDGVKQFLRRSVRPGDAVAIATWSSGPRSAQEFTDDVGKLEAALDSLADEKTQRVQKSEWDYIELERMQLEWFYAQAARLGVTGGSAGMTVSQYDAQSRVVLDVRQKARALSSLMQAMAGSEGQKVLVLLSHRFAPDSGAEYTGIGNDNAVTADAQIDEMLRVAKTNGIRVYPLYATIGDMDIGETASLYKPPSLEDATSKSTLRSMETSSLMNIANETGGVAGTGLGDIDKVFNSVTEDLESYYSLAYRATPESGGRAKRLVVKVKNPAYRVRTRRDVVDRTSETLLRQRIIASLLQPQHTSGFPVNVFLKKARSESGLLHLPLQIKVPVSALTLLPEGASKHSGGFSVYIAWAGALGTSSDITRRSHPVVIDANQLAASKSQVITYDVEVAATRAVDRLVVAVVDDVSQEVGLVRFDMPKPKGK